MWAVYRYNEVLGETVFYRNVEKLDELLALLKELAERGEAFYVEPKN